MLSGVSSYHLIVAACLLQLMGILVEVLPVMVCSSTQPMPVVGVLQKLALGCMVPSGMLFTSFFRLEFTFIELKKNMECVC